MNRIYLGLIISVLIVLSGCGGGGGGSGLGGNPCSDLNIERILNVTGGTQCSFSRSPVVAVVPLNANGDHLVPSGICTGTMVTLDDVLTAAHCITTPLRNGAVAFAIVANETIYGIQNIRVNPLYNGVTGSPFDTAMITIDGVLDIPPVPLIVSDHIAVNEPITIYGYGNDEEGKNALTEGLSALKAGKMRIGTIINGLFGATFDESGSAICQGDSGGPATQTIDGVTGIVGVTSFTFRGCGEGSVSGFVDMQIRGNVNFVLSYAPDVSTR